MELLSVKQASEILNLSRQYIWLAIQLNRLKATRVGKTYVIQRGDLEAYRNSRKAA